MMVFGMDLSDIYLNLDNLSNVDTSDHSYKNRLVHSHSMGWLISLVPNYIMRSLQFGDDEMIEVGVDVVVEAVVVVVDVDGHVDLGVGMLAHVLH